MHCLDWPGFVWWWAVAAACCSCCSAACHISWLS